MVPAAISASVWVIEIVVIMVGFLLMLLVIWTLAACLLRLGIRLFSVRRARGAV